MTTKIKGFTVFHFCKIYKCVDDTKLQDKKAAT